MVRDGMFECPDLEGRRTAVGVEKISRFTKEYAEDLGRWVAQLHLKAGTDVWISDPGGVNEHLRTLKVFRGWGASLS